MHESRAELEALGAVVIGVSFESPDLVAAEAATLGLPCPLYADPSRQVYAAFGMASRDLRSLGRLDLLRAYVAGAFRGQLPHLRSDIDAEQLGGDVVLGPDSRVRLVHRSEHAADRPEVRTLIGALR